MSIDIAVKHPLCGDLSPLQWRVGHGIEPIGALVLDEKAVFRIHLSFVAAIRRAVVNPEWEPASGLLNATPSYSSSTKSSLKINR